MNRAVSKLALPAALAAVLFLVTGPALAAPDTDVTAEPVCGGEAGSTAAPQAASSSGSLIAASLESSTPQEGGEAAAGFCPVGSRTYCTTSVTQFICPTGNGPGHVYKTECYCCPVCQYPPCDIARCTIQSVTYSCE